MPRFIGAYIVKRFNQTAFQQLYEFNIVDPQAGNELIQAVIPVFVTPEVEKTHISEYLAVALGADEAGDEVELTLVEQIFDGVSESLHTFKLPVTVNFAARNRGSEYVQIGMEDLLHYFEYSSYRDSNDVDSPDQFLAISVREGVDRDCIEEIGNAAFAS